MAIITYQDAVRQLQDFVGGTALARSLSDLKRAVTQAYEKTAMEHDWSYYRSTHGFATEASQNSGSVAYVHSTRQLTLSSGTWPATAAYGKVKIGSVIGEVHERTSDTVLTMDADKNFGANIPAGTSYTWFRDTYPLPENFKAMWSPYAESYWKLRPITPDQWLYNSQFCPADGDPDMYAIIQDPDNIGRYAIGLYPAPSSVQTYRMIYRRSPRELWFSGDEDDARAGTVTVSAGGTNVTGTNTAISSRMVGSVIRFGSDAIHHPTDRHGQHPYVDQRIIASCSSGTSFTIDSASSQAFSGVKYIVSDPIDMTGRMSLAFLAKCKVELLAMRPDTPISKSYALVKAEWDETFRDARAEDNKQRALRQTGDGSFSWWRIANMPIGNDVSE